MVEAVVNWFRRVWAVISYDEREYLIRTREARRVRLPGCDDIIRPTLKVEVKGVEEVVMDKPVLTDTQEINGTFWDNMEEAGIDFDDRVKVLESLRSALNAHCGTLYIP
jgi:hypothetical protein